MEQVGWRGPDPLNSGQSRADQNPYVSRFFYNETLAFGGQVWSEGSALIMSMSFNDLCDWRMCGLESTLGYCRGFSVRASADVDDYVAVLFERSLLEARSNDMHVHGMGNALGTFQRSGGPFAGHLCAEFASSCSVHMGFLLK